jgi:hypothetical protein
VIHHNHGASTIVLARGKVDSREQKLLKYFLKNKNGSAVVIIQMNYCYCSSHAVVHHIEHKISLTVFFLYMFGSDRIRYVLDLEWNDDSTNRFRKMSYRNLALRASESRTTVNVANTTLNPMIMEVRDEDDDDDDLLFGLLSSSCPVVLDAVVPVVVSAVPP